YLYSLCSPDLVVVTFHLCTFPTEKLAKRHPRAAFRKELVRVLTPLKSRSTSSPWDSAVEDCWHKRVPSSGSTQTGPISSMTLIVCMVQLASPRRLIVYLS